MTAEFVALLRHFEDLRDRTHGGVVSRADKQRLFAHAVDLLDRPVREVLGEVDRVMLLGEGQITATGCLAAAGGGLGAQWALTWPQQLAVGVEPITIRARYGLGFHHPHLSGRTVGEWPLNVFDAADADAERPVLRAIAIAELHNIVFESDFRIVPATMRGGVR